MNDQIKKVEGSKKYGVYAPSLQSAEGWEQLAGMHYQTVSSPGANM